MLDNSKPFWLTLEELIIIQDVVSTERRAIQSEDTPHPVRKAELELLTNLNTRLKNLIK